MAGQEKSLLEQNAWTCCESIRYVTLNINEKKVKLFKIHDPLLQPTCMYHLITFWTVWRCCCTFSLELQSIFKSSKTFYFQVRENKVFVAGQIPLVPGSMAIIEGGIRVQAVLSLRHVDRILKAMTSPSGNMLHIGCVRLAICYVTSKRYTI